MKRICLNIFLVLTVISCRQPKDLVYKDVQHIKLNGFGINHSTISVDVRMYNPNKYGIQLKDADVDVFVNQTYIGKMFVVNGVYEIPRADTFLLPLNVDVDLKTVLPNALSFLLEKAVVIKLTGKIKAGKHGVYVSVPINYEGRQEI